MSSPGTQMRDRLLFDVWTPHEAIKDYPDDSVGAAFLRLFDEAYDMLVESGQSAEEAATAVRVMFGSSIPTDSGEDS